MRAKSILISCTLALLWAPPLLAQGDCVCSGYNSTRADNGWAFPDGAVFSRARANLTDPAFFGPNGVVNRTIALSATGIQTATEPLLSGVSVFFTGWTLTSSYSAAERNALRAAVLNGMNLVATVDDTAHTIGDLFDVLIEDTGSEMSTAVLPDHPILAGPFGRITQYRGGGVWSHFRSWPRAALQIAANAAGPSMILIPKGALGSGSGAVLLMSDTDALTTFDRALEPMNSEPSIPVTDALVMNIVAFLCNPNAPATAPHLVFPQFANGQNNVSTLNLTNGDSQNSVNATAAFRDDNGAPFFVNIAGEGSVSGTGRSLAANQTASWATNGLGPLKAGTVTVRGSQALAGNVIFFAPGVGATAVPASDVAGGFTLPIVQQPAPTAAGPVQPVDVFTGLAISNLTAKTALVRLELWDTSGRRSDGILTLQIPALGHSAAFLYQIYNTFDFRGFKGTLRIVSRNALISATALQLGSGPGQFVALPIKAQYR